MRYSKLKLKHIYACMYIVLELSILNIKIASTHNFYSPLPKFKNVVIRS